jgi:halimadienyl-diphosphate synthase
VRRVRFLLDQQHREGGWGGVGEYGLVPTLSATEALLTVLRNMPPGNGSRVRYEEVMTSVDRGLRTLFKWLGTDNQLPLPDTVAVEIVVPGLIDEINSHLDRLDREPLTELAAWNGGHRLPPPPGADGELLAGLRKQVSRGHLLPTKLLHSLEAIGPVAQGAPFVEPVQGSVGCSPAATAVWLGDRAVRARRHPTVRYLEAAQERGGGPVPVATPLAVFERSWVLSTLTGANITISAPQALARSLHAAFGEFGVAGGSGLPPDADDTATALYALARLGSPRSPDCLWTYRAEEHFVCFPAERTPSTSTNAHVLQAIGACLAAGLPRSSRYLDTVDELSGWLCDQQEADGNWRDKWHASPYYATACCAVALADHGGDRVTATVRKAVEWVLGTQRPDGSWGRWAGTQEETAYAMQILLRTRTPRADNVIERAAARGCLVLLRSDQDPQHPPLWHDKDLYTPVRIVCAERLAALHLARANPRVAALITGQGAARTCSCASGNEAG